MKPEAQRIAVAEACGWKRYNTEGTDAYLPDHPDDPTFPDYLNDLNAMHEAEKVLTAIQCNDYDTYIVHFLRNSEIYPPANRFKFHATAAQRAEAFIRTIGKWNSDKINKTLE